MEIYLCLLTGKIILESNGYKRLKSSIYEKSELTKFQKRAMEEGRKIYTFTLKKVS